MSRHAPARRVGTVRIDAEACKGCELCVAVCPPSVLVLGDARNSRGYVVPELLEGCTGCRRCAAICPDFALQVYDLTPGP